MPPMPEPREEAAADGGAKRADAEQAETQQRKRRVAALQAVASEQRERRAPSRPSISRRAQSVLAEHFEHVRQQRDAGAEQDQADDVERMRLGLAIVGQMAINEIQPERGRSAC